MPAKLLNDPADTETVRRHAYVVLGMHRSGTSAMTRTLSLLGAALPKRLMPAVASNESGFWEPQSIADLNDEILQAQDSQWDDVFSFRQRQYLSNFDRFYLGRAVDLLEQEFNGAEVIVLKDPRISILTAFWDRALLQAGYEVHYIIMVRNPLEVAESLRARDGFPREKSFLLWSSYMIAVDRDTRHRARTFVSYDQLMTDWRSVRARVEASTGVPFPRDNAAAAIEIDRYLDRGLRHHEVSPHDLFTGGGVPEQVRTIYRIFADACEGKEVDGTALEALEAELSKIEQLVGPLFADFRLSARTLTREIAELKDAVAASDGRVKGLVEDLERERLEHGRSVSEIEKRVEALLQQIETERSEYGRDAAEIQGQLVSLREQIETERSEHARKLSEIATEADQVRERFEAGLRDQQQLNASLAERLTERESELVQKEEQFQSLFSRLEISQENLESTKNRLRSADSRIEQLLHSIREAKSASEELEQRLNAHFDETAKLTRMLLDTEEQTVRESEKAARIRGLYDAVLSQPRWWWLLPQSQRSRLQKARLRRLGVFDAEAYLLSNPDVAAAGEDPVHHFLHHGINEQREL